MLRISVSTDPSDTTVTLEGRVVGLWVDELTACWRRLRVSAAPPIRVNLDGITFIDAAGKAVLRAMHADGAVLRAHNVMMRAVIDQIAAGHHETTPLTQRKDTAWNTSLFTAPPTSPAPASGSAPGPSVAGCGEVATRNARSAPSVRRSKAGSR